jgi:energy-converting hydrogenase Eha subunit E
MIDTFLSGGLMMWPLLVITIGVAWMAVRVGALLRAPEPQVEEAHRRLQAILFWGAISIVVGVLGTAVGLVVVARAISRFGAVDSALAWSGVGVALIPFVFGILIFLLAAFTWVALRHWTTRAERRAVATA